MRIIMPILMASLCIVMFSSLGVYADNSSIPDWVKNTAKWWADDQIGESDYISSLQYLINQDIIKIPITEVVATNVNLEDKDRAMSIVVNFSDGIVSKPITLYTFHTFYHFSKNVGTTQLDFSEGLETTPAFTLQSLPSKDKTKLYELVNMYTTAVSKLPFTVTVEIMSGDGTLLQTWDYKSCNIEDYSVFVNNNKENYRFSDTDDAEIRELFVFGCSGFRLNT